MATIRSFSQIVQSMIDATRLRQPALDTKTGTVSRDLFIDIPADQLAIIYRELQSIQKTQSLLSSTGQTLNQFGSNFGINRDTGKKAVGTAILTFNNLLNNIIIENNPTITAKTGIVFRITANITISASAKNIYSSFASSISEQLHVAGISDQYAIAVPIEAINIGASGNIPVYSLIRTSIPGISNVTNIEPTDGGTNPQGDSQYRNQILAGLSGSSAGTARGYQNALLGVSGIKGVFIASPGDPILTRDGTITQRQTDGSLIVLSTGTGGKVDVWIYGSDLKEITESYVFHDLSGTGDITSSLNAHVLGQTTDMSNLTALERRQNFIRTGELPLQPVDSIITLSGSVSGANFVQDVNFELVRDTNQETQNTAFALDKIIFLRDFIEIVNENVVKGDINSVDNLGFRRIKAIDNINQDIIITNDVAKIDNLDRSKLLISRAPLTTVLRATNLTTGERYTIINQNLDVETGLNTTGEIFIDGSSLPSPQDLIQVDYIWHYEYDTATDYFNANGNQTLDAIDWGKSNFIKFDNGTLIRDGGRYKINVSASVDRIYNAFYCDTQITSVQQASINDQANVLKSLRQITINDGFGPVVYFVIPGINLISSGVSPGNILHISLDAAPTSRNGTYTIISIVDQDTLQIERPTIALAAQIANATIEIRASNDVSVIITPTAIINLETTSGSIDGITNVVSVVSQTTGLELFATEEGGSFSGNVIYLASDVVLPNVGEEVRVYFNSAEIFNVARNNGSLLDNTIVLSTDDVLDFNNVLDTIDDIYNGVNVKPILINYAAENINVIAETDIEQMPFVGSISTATFVNKDSVALDSRQPIEFNFNNDIVRFGPSTLVFNVDGAFSSGGTFGIRGTAWFKITSAITISQNNVNGLFDLLDTITANIGTISTTYQVAKLVSATIINGENTQNLFIRGYEIKDNTYDHNAAVAASDLSATELDLNAIFLQNDLVNFTIGTGIQLTFYVLAPRASETIQFSTGRGTLYSKYKYTRIDRFDLLSGFTNPVNSSITGTLLISSLAQPATNSTYLADYSYFGQVENDRLTITYRHNNIITTATNAIENVRTLTADVLTRLTIQVFINISMTIIISKQATNQQRQVLDQVISVVNNLITAAAPGSTLDYSAFLRVATSINGVDGADVSVFDFEGSEFDGQANRKSITIDPNQNFAVGTINIVAGSR